MNKALVAIVTGGGNGMGAAISKRLSKDGFTISIADLNEEAASKVVEEIKSTGGKARYSVTDVSDPESVKQAIADTIEEFGDFNVIVNNAGLLDAEPIGNVSPETFHKIMNINTGGVLWGIQEASNAFKKLGHGGKIISTSSQAGIKGNAGSAVYSASKFAVRGLTQAAAQELASFGITVNAYAPGFVETEGLRGALQMIVDEKNISMEEAEKPYTDNITLGKLSTVENVANVVSFLAGPDSDYITGQTIVVDGGMVFH